MSEDRFFGKDCPKGKVQVEFVGCPPSEKQGEYGWKPVDHTFLEIYVDGDRFRLEVGSFHDGTAQRRGIHICGPMDFQVEKTAINAASVFIQPKG